MLMEPTEILPIIAILSIVSVEFGGHALLRLVTTDRDRLGALRERFFRAGHAHAGVLLVLSLVYLLYLPQEGRRSPGTLLTRIGALLPAAALIALAAGLVRAA
jgi:hypothetical protein